MLAQLSAVQSSSQLLLSQCVELLGRNSTPGFCVHGAFSTLSAPVGWKSWREQQAPHQGQGGLLWFAYKRLPRKAILRNIKLYTVEFASRWKLKYNFRIFPSVKWPRTSSFAFGGSSEWGQGRHCPYCCPWGPVSMTPCWKSSQESKSGLWEKLAHPGREGNSQEVLGGLANKHSVGVLGCPRVCWEF